MTGFWKQWMIVWCAAVIALGIALSAMAFPATDGLGRLYWSLAGAGAEATAFDAPGMRFAVAVLGAVSIGWGMTMLTMVRTSTDPATWRGLTIAVVGWFVIDSLLSVATGFPINALLNIGFLAAFLVPVLGSGVLGGAARVATA